jgi:hypothetical protein
MPTALVLNTLDPARRAGGDVAASNWSGSSGPRRMTSESSLPALSEKFAAAAAAEAAAEAVPPLPDRQASTGGARPGMRRSISEGNGAFAWQMQQGGQLQSPFGASSFPSRAPLGQNALGPHVLGVHSACSSFAGPSMLSSPFGSQTALSSRAPAAGGSAHAWLANPFSASRESSCSSGGAIRPSTPAQREGSSAGGIAFGGVLDAPLRAPCECGSLAPEDEDHLLCPPQPGIAGVSLRKELHIGARALSAPLPMHSAPAAMHARWTL